MPGAYCSSITVRPGTGRCPAAVSSTARTRSRRRFASCTRRPATAVRSSGCSAWTPDHPGSRTTPAGTRAPERRHLLPGLDHGRRPAGRARPWDRRGGLGPGRRRREPTALVPRRDRARPERAHAGRRPRRTSSRRRSRRALTAHCSLSAGYLWGRGRLARKQPALNGCPGAYRVRAAWTAWARVSGPVSSSLSPSRKNVGVPPTPSARPSSKSDRTRSVVAGSATASS
jgi:hypothetical protein